MGVKITKLLAEFQADHPVAVFDKKGQAGGSRQYGYASYNAVIECLKPLASKGLAWYHLVAGSQNADGTYSLHVKTCLTLDEEMIATEIVRPMMPDIQKLGSEITYLKRYQLVALCGMAADEDDDGASAMPEPPTKTAAKPANPRAPAKPAEPAASPTRETLDKALAALKNSPTPRKRQELLATVGVRVKEGKLTSQDYHEFGRSMLTYITDPDEANTNAMAAFEIALEDKIIDDKLFSQLSSLVNQRVHQLASMAKIGGTMKEGA